MTKVAMYGKGGIGKSTISSNITAALSDSGVKVLQIGCDPKHDSTRLLLNGEVEGTILDYLKDVAPADRRIEDILSVGYGGCLCAEAGGPEPGVGCAGRGIITSFDLLHDLGIDSIRKDITLYDVLGDVVCGGFAVPLRNEYADIVFIVSSGEFMSIYAANNILKGICNYDPNRVGGIIFNSRGDPEEEGRIRRFTEAVGIPIVASFERSQLFMSAEENGKTVVEMYPESPIADEFRRLAERIMKGDRYRSNYLSEEELERIVLGRSLRRESGCKPHIATDVVERPKRKYMSRNVQWDEPYGGCAFSGAYSTCASIEGLAIVLHAPLSCAQFTVQTVTHTYGRYNNHQRPIDGFSRSDVLCSEMRDSDMIFGGTSRLRSRIEAMISSGHKDVAVITSCPSGIIGDDVKGVVTSMENEHPDCRIVLIGTDGCLNGDFMQGVIDAGIAIAERFSVDCEKTDSVNLVGTKSLALNCMDVVDTISELLNDIGIGVNCLFPGAGDLESLSKISSARMNLMINPDLFTIQLSSYLNDRFGTEVSPIPVRPGICGTSAWLGYLARYFGREDECSRLMEDIRTEFYELVSGFRHVLEGKRFHMVSASRDIDWMIEATDAVGMIRERTIIIDHTDFSNDLDVMGDIPDAEYVKSIDIEKERDIIRKANPDLIISTAHMGLDIPNVLIPTVSNPNPFTGVEFVRSIALLFRTYRKEGWREDVVRS